MTTNDQQFIEALKLGDLHLLRQIPKADKHCHMDLGGSFEGFQRLTQKVLKAPPQIFHHFDEFQNYILDELDPIFSTVTGTKLAKLNTIEQSRTDTILLLEASIDDGFSYHFKNNVEELINYLAEGIQRINPLLDFRPELGLGRTDDIKALEDIAFFNIETGYFKSIDLYGNELDDDPKRYVSIFRRAKAAGLKLKVHIGEFSDADSIKRTIEVLEVDEIQHGIHAAKSTSLMRYLSENQIVLNICPTSNVKLGAVKTIEAHPIRKLYDHQVKVTINTDDYLIFNRSLSEEFLWLYQSQLFNAEELNEIRKNGLQ